MCNLNDKKSGIKEIYITIGGPALTANQNKEDDKIIQEFLDTKPVWIKLNTNKDE